MRITVKILIITGLLFSIIGCSNDKESTSDILGCTDPQAINYLPEATVDDGTCEYDQGSPVYGCMDSTAVNYNPDVTEDDGSCTYNSAPDWSVNPSLFQYNGALTATIEINELPVGSENDMLAGFVGDEIRGVTSGMYFSPTDKYLFMITLYSENISGDAITFKYYNESEDQILSLKNEIVFESNMILGSPLEPVVLSGVPSVEEYFSFAQSAYQAFYLIQSADIDGVSLNSEDQIGIFYQSVCIGSSSWSGEYTTVPAMGDDGTGFTVGYIINGEMPQFKIYDASEEKYFDAMPGGIIDPGLEWSNLAIINIEILNAQTE